jgi:hypothetical protein
MEHRWHRRIPVSIPVTLHFNDGACAGGEAANISRGGIFVATLMPPSRAGCVDVRLALPDCEDRVSIRLPAIVVHRGEHGLGLMFRSLDAQAEAAVLRLTGSEPEQSAAHAYPDPRPGQRPGGWLGG